MDNKTYQKATKEFAIYPKDWEMEYLVLGLASEAGEVAGKLKKLIRGDYTEDALSTHNLEKYNADLKAELGDCLWYISEICSTIGVQLGDVMADNIAKLTARKEAATIKGNGDDR